jgi:hypothetical protein
MSTKQRPDEQGDAIVVTPRPRGGKPKASDRGRWWMLLPVIFALAGGAGYLGWQEVGSHVLAGAQYQIEPDQIRVAPEPPPWIHSDIRADVIRDAQLNGPLALTDRDLTVRMAAAFAAHPWVARVERVSKHYPSGLDVTLSYRKPAALVEVEDGAGGLPVDGEGVLLPTKDFSADDARRYPRIGEIHTRPAGPLGTAWGDPCVAGAAQIAAILTDHWNALGLMRIVPAERRPGRTGVEYTFALLTSSGTKVHWGLAPGTSARGELAASEKIAQLRRYAATNNGSLDDPDGQPHEIIISRSGALLSNPRPKVDRLPE